MPLPACADLQTPALRQAILELGQAWAAESGRPRIPDATLLQWDRLLDAWIEDRALPLLIRKARGDRGATQRSAGGRPVVPVDNSPAQWAFAIAYDGICPKPTEIAGMLQAGEIPIAMALSRGEQATAVYRGLRGRCPSTNDAGWKLAHLEDVALRGRGALAGYADGLLEGHFRRLMSPRNMFVVPLGWAGLAEVPEFIEGFRAGGGVAAAT